MSHQSENESTQEVVLEPKLTTVELYLKAKTLEALANAHKATIEAQQLQDKSANKTSPFPNLIELFLRIVAMILLLIQK